MSPATLKKIRLALRNTAPWPLGSRRLRALSDAELAEAESFERLGRRREKMLRILLAERKRRQGRGGKMLNLNVEARL